eukprot:scaffold12009_cov61-Cyclotella_meneghiniana.AAC.1
MSLAEMGHFVRVMATLISRPVVVMRTQKFSETIEGVLVEVAQSLDGAGWVVGELVLAAADAAYSPLSIAFLVI